MKKIKKFKILLIVLGVILLVMLPVPAADVYVRIHFQEIAGNACALYYTTKSEPGFTQDNCILSEIDAEKNQVTFLLDGMLADQLTGFRLDFPNNEDLICISSVTVSSAGVVQKQYDPCDFFAEENIVVKNGIEAISLVKIRNRAYIKTNANDPFVILSDALVSQINDSYSHYRLSRLLVCVFAVGCYFMAKTKVFSSKKNLAEMVNVIEG